MQIIAGRFVRLRMLALLPASVLAYVPAAAQDTATRRIAERVGLTPVQTRTLYTRVDALGGEIDNLSHTNGIQSRTLRAIALELGARNPNLSQERFLEAIQSLAGRAAEAQEQIASLSATIATLDPGGEHRRAQTLLTQAQTAFENGRLEDAETAFGELAFLRLSEMAQARTAWIEAVDLQAESASLRGDTERATEIRMAKIEEIQWRREEADRDGQEEEWRTAMAIADDWRVRGDRLGDNAAIERGITYYRELALPLASREREPLRWARTQHDLGNALTVLGARENGTAQLDEAVLALRQALEERTRNRAPLDWARSQYQLGLALIALGSRGNGTVQLEAGLAAARQALNELTRENAQSEWISAKVTLGLSLMALYWRDSDAARLEDAIVAYRQALEEESRQSSPTSWAVIQINLGNALSAAGQRSNRLNLVEDAVIAYRLALEESPRDLYPLKWAMIQNNIGVTLMLLGRREDGTARMKEAVAAYRRALEERTRERVPLAWAYTQHNLGFVLGMLSERGEPELRQNRRTEAEVAFRNALEERTRELWPYEWVWTNLYFADLLINTEVSHYEIGGENDLARRIRDARATAAENAYQSAENYADGLLLRIQQMRNSAD